MKKKSIVISIITIVVLIVVFTFFREKRSFIDVMIKMGTDPKDIIYVEYVDNGVFVFTRTLSDNLINVFVKKNIFGWKYGYDGVQGGMKPMFEKCGLSFTSLPKVKSMPYALYYGIIDDTNIMSVKVLDNESRKEFIAKIVETDKGRLWIAPVDSEADVTYTIISFSSKGKEISKIKDTPTDFKVELYNN